MFIKNLSLSVGKEVELKGWVYNLRSSGSIAFLQIRDGSGFVQAIVDKKSVPEAVWETAQKITVETSVIVHGRVSAHPKHPGVFEIQVGDLKIVQLAEEFPIGKKEHGPDFLLDIRHLWLRAPRQWAIQRVRNTIINATYEFFNQNDFIKIDAPILTPTSCENTTELFGMKYFDEGNAYLTQSGQLYIESAIFSHGRVFDFGPVFRAEKSKTRRHLTEFWMMDAEMAFVEHVGNLEIQENLVSFIVNKVLEINQEELKILERDVKPLENVKAPFYRLSHEEAVKKLRKLGSDIKADHDLGGDDETTLTKEYDKPVFVEKYPAKIKAFYMKRDPQDESRALCADLLAPEGYGEVIGGSQREDDYETLLRRLKEFGLKREPFEWYLDLRRYGSVPHSGFGYGLERLVTWICGLSHVRESIPFPRMINRLKP